MRRLFFHVALGATMLLGGCVGYNLVEPKRTTVGNALSVEPSIAWNRKTNEFPNAALVFLSPHEIWTIDGESIEKITFFVGVKDGQALLKLRNDKNESLPAFHASMNATDIVALYEAALSKETSISVIETLGVTPAKFGLMNGFRFEMSYTGKDEVDRQLRGYGVINKGLLYLAVFEGPKLYHYGKYQAEFDKMVGSVEFF